MDDDKNAKKYNLPSEALIIMIFTALSYWLSFKYESAYFAAFDIPLHLIDVSTSSILSIFAILSGLAILIYAIANFLLMNWPEHPAIQIKLIRIIILLFFVLWHLLSYGFRKEDIAFYIIFLIFISFFEFVWPLIIHKNNEKFKDKVLADEMSESKTFTKSLWGRIQLHMGPFYYSLLMFLWISTSLVNTAGDAKAKTQEIFPVCISDTTIAIIRAYNEKLICVRFDYKEKQVKSFLIINPLEKSSEYCNKRIGPLVSCKRKLAKRFLPY